MSPYLPYLIGGGNGDSTDFAVGANRLIKDILSYLSRKVVGDIGGGNGKMVSVHYSASLLRRPRGWGVKNELTLFIPIYSSIYSPILILIRG